MKTSKSAIATPLFATMTHDELKAVATSLNVPVGKNVKATVSNLSKAIQEGKAHVKAVFTISFKPDDGSAPRKTHFGKTLRTYVSGPGNGDQTWLTPDAAVNGSPAPAGDEEA